MKIFLTAFAAALFLASCSSGLNTKRIQEVQDKSLINLKTNLEFHASDDLGGREATTQSARIAAKFLATQLKQLGIKPYGDDGTYFQNFKLQKSRYLENTKLNLVLDGNIQSLKFGDDFAAFSAGNPVEGSELVYVQFGITDSITGYDDYKDLDVKGKTVVCVAGTPSDSLYKNMNSGLGRSNAKAKMAADHGADGVIMLLNERYIRWWSRIKRSATSERIGEIDNNSKTTINGAYPDTLIVKSLFSVSDSSYSGLLKALESGQLAAGTALNGKADWDIQKDIQIVNARNVVGMLDGYDPEVADQLITIGAHFDHEGIKGGEVYNGANDNGSGTVAVLEVARQLSELKMNRRPVIILFYTAEEKGLIGSKYFTDNFNRMDDVVVNINLDMVGRGAPDTLFVIGSGRISSEFFNIVEQANKETANFVYNYKLDAKDDPERIYYRSDSYSFARKDKPTVFLTDNESKDYHRPTDDWDKIDYVKLAKVSHLATNILLQTANLDHPLLIDHADISGPVFKVTATGDDGTGGTINGVPIPAPPQPKTEENKQSKK
ncbi:MAG: M20/M25/M40 family metallo-hydrolase [Calditrichaeota bacterium]|nr:M20/M25/M40 family metallo-hydrolase [Calditrichota bacterium]